MKFRITVLCENSVGPISGTLGEHGFSALIEPSQGEPLLFDTGQGLTLLHNAQRMNKNLSSVNNVVISHGHYDHCDGLLPLLSEHGPKLIFAHPGIFSPRFRLKDNRECYSIGMSYRRDELEAAGASFTLSKEYCRIAPGIFLTGEVPRITSFETGDNGIYCDCSSREVDNTPDDQSLILETNQGLAVILGCCHSGLVNTLEHIACLSCRRDIHTVIGGTHLGFCGQDQLELTISALKNWGVKRVAASHCTGFTASARMLRALPKVFQTALVGYSLEI